MIFSRMMDYAIEAHFRKDQSGRLVFIPFSRKGKGYFVESTADEMKIRAFVKIFRSAMQLISWLSFPSIFVPAIILDDYAGLSPRGHRLAIALGVPLFFWLVLSALAWMIWSSYKGAMPTLTSSLREVGPDVMGQLRANPDRRRRLRLLVAAILLLVGVALLAYLTS
jgi:hypothetical protein